MSAPPVRLSRRGAVASITISNGTANRLDEAVAQGLCSAAESLVADESIAVVILHGRPDSFCGGGAPPVDWATALAGLPQPLVAVVGGDAIDEGAELALVADIRLCSRRARFRFGQVADGRLPNRGGTQRLPRTVGRMRALDILMTGRWVRSAEARRIGIATEVLPAEQLSRRARELAKDLAGKGPIALRYAKEAVTGGLDLTLDHGIRLEQDLYVLLQTTDDRAEGIRSFLEKRRPAYRGR